MLLVSSDVIVSVVCENADLRFWLGGCGGWKFEKIWLRSLTWQDSVNGVDFYNGLWVAEKFFIALKGYNLDSAKKKKKKRKKEKQKGII